MTPIERLRALARDTRAQYGTETAAGGEPAYPAWVDDVAAVCDELERLRASGPCAHVWEGRPIDGSTSANVPSVAVCRECGQRGGETVLAAPTPPAAAPLGSMNSPHTSPGGPGQPVPMPASAAVNQSLTTEQPSLMDVRHLWDEATEATGGDGLEAMQHFARLVLARYGAQPAAPHSDLERARQGLPPYNPSMPTEQDWQRITENGRKAWGGAQAAASAEPVARATVYMRDGRRQVLICELGTAGAAALTIGEHDLYAAPVAAQAQPDYPGATVADRLDAMADDCAPGSQRAADLRAAATVWRKHLAGPAAQPKRRPYNTNGSLSEYGIFPECDAAPAAEAPAKGADVVLPHPLGIVDPNPTAPRVYTVQDLANYAREAVLADRQQRGGDVIDDMRAAVRFAPSSAYWSERLREFFGPDAREGIDALEKQLRKARAALAAQKADDARDAERYRWLRRNVGAERTNGGKGPVSVYLLWRPPASDSVAAETDAAIDAAMSKEGKQ